MAFIEGPFLTEKPIAVCFTAFLIPVGFVALLIAMGLVACLLLMSLAWTRALAYLGCGVGDKRIVVGEEQRMIGIRVGGRHCPQGHPHKHRNHRHGTHFLSNILETVEQ